MIPIKDKGSDFKELPTPAQHGVWAGAGLCLILAGFSYLTSRILGIPGGTVTHALILGVILAPWLNSNPRLKPGLGLCEKSVLSAAIVCMGFQFHWGKLLELGPSILIAPVLSIAVSFLALGIVGPFLGLSRDQWLLLAAGNGICGTSAIMSLKNLLNTKTDDIALSVSMINFLGMVAIPASLLLPEILQNLHEQAVVIGATLQSVGHVGASGFLLSDQIGKDALVIKMVRILGLVPLLLIMGFLKEAGSNQAHFIPPVYILGFFAASVFTSLQWLPPQFLEYLSLLFKLLLAMSMASIGLQFHPAAMRESGFPVFLGASIGFLAQVVVIILFLKFAI